MAVGSAPRVRLSPCQMAEIGISTGPVSIEIIKTTRAMPPSIERANTRFVSDRLDKLKIEFGWTVLCIILR